MCPERVIPYFLSSIKFFAEIYYSISDGGTTAAERFFCQKHPNLYEYIVNNVKPAPRAYYKKESQN